MDNPPIRILQRPCQPSDNQTSQFLKPPTTVKTLEQREADYAAARRRIMGSDGSESDGDDPSSTKGNITITGSANGHIAAAAPRLSSVPTTNVTAATPLMSIQATPANVNALNAEFGVSTVTPLTSNVGQSRMSHNCSARQGFAVVNVAQKLQQQQTHTASNVTRPALQTQQPHRLLTASASSPSFFNSRNPSQPVPLFPSNAANAGLLPTPPGFNYSMQNATLNSNGGMHHSQSTAYALMQQFGLFQQHYQQALNGFQSHLVPSMSQTGLSLNPFNLTVSSQPTPNQKYTHPPTFN